MKTLTALLVIATVAAWPGAQNGAQNSTQNTDAERRVIAARDTVWRAWYANDTALLHRFIPPAAATLGDGRGWNDRAQIIADAKEFAKSRVRLRDLKFSNNQITLAGHTALVQADYQTIVDAGPRADTTRGHATELFVLVDGTWVNPYWQLEPLRTSVASTRAIAMPDTLGAHFSIADSAAKRGTLADYDALIGTWEFRFQSRQQDGRYGPPFTGHWTFEKKPGGGLIEDHWRPDDPTTPMGVSLYTYRLFDSDRKVWQMIGAGSRGGKIKPGLTWSDDSNRYAIQAADEGGMVRIRYLSITANHFLWRQDYSGDGGKTWTADVGIMEANRIGK